MKFNTNLHFFKKNMLKIYTFSNENAGIFDTFSGSEKGKFDTFSEIGAIEGLRPIGICGRFR